MAETDYQKAKRIIKQEQENVTRGKVYMNSLESEFKHHLEEVNEKSEKKFENEIEAEAFADELKVSIQEKVMKLVKTLRDAGKWE